MLFFFCLFLAFSSLIAHNFQSNAKSRFALWFCVIAAEFGSPLYHLSRRFISNEIHFNSFAHFTFYFFPFFLFGISVQFAIICFFSRVLFIRHDETDGALKALISFHFYSINKIHLIATETYLHLIVLKVLKSAVFYLYFPKFSKFGCMTIKCNFRLFFMKFIASTKWLRKYTLIRYWILLCYFHGYSHFVCMFSMKIWLICIWAWHRHTSVHFHGNLFTVSHFKSKQ